VRLRPQHANHVWSYDFVSAKTHDGRTVRLLNLIDEHTRESLLVRTFVSFYREQKKVFETAPIAVTSQPGSRLGVTPISFSISLGELAVGRYECQVSVLDPSGHRVAFWLGSIMLVR
jgi:hypothetical protein